MDKRELIDMLEALDVPDDTEVIISNCYNTRGDADEVEIDDVEVDSHGRIEIECTSSNCCDPVE